jgi:outer membrane receptor protein involved in Fe transport
VALLVSSPLVPRSSAQAKSDPVAPPADSEEIVLSPFTILASQDKGYQATSTLAGTRLRSNLSDIASPISIFTKDLLKDIAATNFQDAMRYSINVENEREYASDDTEGESIASTTQNRVRGLGVGTQTRNFFKTNVRADSYNTERLTVSSGPSSILFGIGSPAGTIDSTPITANLRKVSAEVSVRADNNGSIRGSIDINVPVEIM